MAEAFGENFAIDDELQIAVRPHGTQLQIFDYPQGRARAAVRETLHLLLPDIVGRAAYADSGALVLMIGPGKWLLSAPLSDALFPTLVANGVRVIDVSSGRAVIRISGQHAARLIEMGCGLDLAELPPGSCANTLMTQTAALIHRLQDGAGFDIYVARSFSQSVWEWIVESAQSQHANEWKD